MAGAGGDMPWFVIQCERKTWTKYLVEADDEDTAIDSDDWQYLGYVDGEDTEDTVVGGPFGDSVEALADICSYFEG
jgi:hypothetical protein